MGGWMRGGWSTALCRLCDAMLCDAMGRHSSTKRRGRECNAYVGGKGALNQHELESASKNESDGHRVSPPSALAGWWEVPAS